MAKQYFRLIPKPHPARDNALAAIMAAPDGTVVMIDSEPPRNLEQNSLIHPVCRKIQLHLESHGAAKRNEDWWRYYLVAKFGGQEIVPDPDGNGGFVVCNKVHGTSSMSKMQASNFIEWLYAFGIEIGITWDE